MISFTFTPRSYLHFDHPITKESAEQFATKPQLVASYAFLPFIRYEVVTQKIRKAKGGGVELRPPKRRPIDYAAHKDSHIFAYYSAILGQHYEAALRNQGLQRAVTAFRPIDRQSNIHFADEVFEFIRHTGDCAVLATDVSDYFGQIKHLHLKRAWHELLGLNRLPPDHFAVFEAITQYSIVYREKLCAVLKLSSDTPRADGRNRYCSPRQFRDLVRGNGLIQVNRTGVGIPQGSAISAMLSNIYLLDFDQKINSFVTTHGGLYRRYCDDILLVLPTIEQRAHALALMQSLLTELGLIAHPDKTELVDFAFRDARLTTPKPLNYLGFTFDGQFKRLRPASVARFYKKMRRGVARARALKAKSTSGPQRPLSRRRLYLLYSYIGKRNFIAYALRAAQIMNDPGIKQQVKAHWKKLRTLIQQ